MARTSHFAHKVTISQFNSDGVAEATFKLTEREYQLMPNWRYGSIPQHQPLNWFAWAHYGISESKSARFYRTFRYRDGGLFMVTHHETL